MLLQNNNDGVTKMCLQMIMDTPKFIETLLIIKIGESSLKIKKLLTILYFNIKDVTFVLIDCNYKRGEIHVFD